MKKLILMVFVLISYLANANNDENSSMDLLKNFKDKKNIEFLTSEQKDELLILRKEYFSKLQVIQEEEKKLRKVANEYMMKNEEEKYEETHDKMNSLKIKKEIIKENYRKKIEEILEETGRIKSKEL